MQIPENTLYLYQQVDIDPRSSIFEVILARKSQDLRGIINAWWDQLDPEQTAGVPTPIFEKALAALAHKALKDDEHRVREAWARSWFNWKPGFFQSEAERVIGKRFLSGAERLGILSRQDSAVSFSHPLLLELYFGLRLLLKEELPAELDSHPRRAYDPVQTPQGRSVLARLALTPPQEIGQLLETVAEKNLHLAAWFLYSDEEDRGTSRRWLAQEILGEFLWEDEEEIRHSLRGSLLSLGPDALPVCRDLLDAREANLQAYIAAIAHLNYHGTLGDLPRLERVASDPDLGQWEIDQLRAVLKQAESLVVDDENQKRYTRAELLDYGKKTAWAVARVALVAVSVRAPSNSPLATANTASPAVDNLVTDPGSDFYQQQQVLRQQIHHLPRLIKRRKGRIARTAPKVRQAAQEAIQAIERR